jgi:hypothetical protein
VDRVAAEPDDRPRDRQSPWQKHFGRGIVATLENFGKMG